MAESQPTDDLIQRWQAWSIDVMRKYHGYALLWGEEVALKWLKEQTFEGGDASA